MKPNKFLVPAVAMGATWAVKRGLESGYKVFSGGEPPRADDKDAKLLGAIAWAVTTAAAVALIEVVVTRMFAPSTSTEIA